MIFATHGHLYGEKNPPKLKGEDILLCGHTHIPAHTQYENYRYINPGSVSIPKENSPHAYMVITEEEILYKTLAGEIYRREKL
jgi:putative phosphoesterase